LRLERILCSWFGAGWLKPAPGTWGSAAALPLGWLLWWLGGTPALAKGLEDPSWVVIDEVVGQWLTLLLTPPSLLDYALGFALFRLFDIWKPWPVSWADQQIKGGLGIMLDDVLAGLMGLAVLTLLQKAGLP
jgi:phosphatidylglycerophosphatase A